jgi:1-deoxy-D-xylulose-5-phosphate reductoisomerase
VAAFLAGKCGFNDISCIVEQAVDRFLSGAMSQQACDTIEVIMAIEAEAGRITEQLLKSASDRPEAL